MKEKLIELKSLLEELKKKKVIPYVVAIPMITTGMVPDTDIVLDNNLLDEQKNPDKEYEIIIDNQEIETQNTQSEGKHIEIAESKYIDNEVLAGVDSNNNYSIFNHVENNIQIIEGYMQNNINGDITDVKTKEYIEQKEVTNAEKIAWITNYYGITEYQFNVLCAMVLHEAKANSYEDAYAVMNVIFNRANSYKWSTYIDRLYGKGKGTNLYYQATAKGQFVPYNQYQKYMYKTNTIAYQASIDMLYSQNIMHYYMSFRSAGSPAKNRVQFVSGGNRYFDYSSEADRLYVTRAR